MGTDNGKPDVSAVNRCPKKPIAAPYTGPRTSAARKPGSESKAIVPNSLIYEPTNDSAINNAVKTRVFVLIPGFAWFVFVSTGFSP